MSRSTPPPRNRHSSLRTPLIVAAACVALTIPGTVSASSQSVRQQAAPASNVVAVPKLTVLYPNDADVKYFAAMSANGAHVYLGSATDLVNDGGATESSQPWDVIATTATRIFSPSQPGFIGLTHVSPDGRSFVVYTANELTGVTDPGYDLYLIHDGVTKLASAGTASDNQVARWLADDGSRMVFQSDDDIAGTGDSNGVTDLYEYTASTNKETLVNPDIANAAFLRASPDGQHILVVDSGGDGTSAFEYIGTTSTLRSAGTLAGFSADSSKVFFTSTQSLVAGDTDGGLLDGYYSDSAGVMHLMDLNLAGLTGTDAPKSLRLSPDGSHWLLSTDASLVPADTNGTTDFYVGSASGWTLIPGGLGTTSQLLTTANDSVIVWASADPAVAGDTDGTTDIYRWSAANPGTTDILTDGTISATSTVIRGLSSDGSRVIFSTDESLVAGDGDTAIDLYRWEGGTNTLLTPGSASDVTFKAASTDGKRVAFSSVDQLVGADTNSIENVYLSDEDTTAPTATISLPSTTGPTADATLGSSDGSALFFSCKLDGNPLVCSTSTHITGLTPGSHTLDVKGYDAAWNASPTATKTWTATADTTPPVVSSVSNSPRTGGTFSGTSAPWTVSWAATDAGGSGIASYQLDQSTNGGPYTTVSSSLTTTSTQVFVSSGFTYKFRVRATDGSTNVGAFKEGASFKVTGISQAYSAVHYTGTWANSTSTAWWGGTAKSSSTKNSTASYTFTGKSIAWVALKSYNRGKANIYINGVLKATVDLYAPATLTKRVVWSTTYSTSASRTLMIKVMATSGRPRVDVDGFLVGT